MFSYYNPSPSGARVGDCAVRAVSKALGTDWETAYMLLSAKGYAMHDLPNANSVINSVLREYGFEREIIPNECPDCQPNHCKNRLRKEDELCVKYMI